VDRADALLIVPLYLLSPSELAPNEDQGIGVWRHRCAGQRDAGAAHALYRADGRIFKETPEFDHSFQITFPSAALAACW
jgi:multidrug efflux pump